MVTCFVGCTCPSSVSSEIESWTSSHLCSSTRPGLRHVTHRASSPDRRHFSICSRLQSYSFLALRINRQSFLLRETGLRFGTRILSIYCKGQETEGNPEDLPEEPNDIREKLNTLLDAPSFNAYDLHQLIVQKWGFSYDLQIRKVAALGGEVVVNVMWRYLEQQSFPMTSEEYLMNLEAIAQLLGQWGAVDYVREFVRTTKEKPRVGKAVSIPIPINSQRAAEFLNLD